MSLTVVMLSALLLAPVQAAPRPKLEPLPPGPHLFDRDLELVRLRYADAEAVDPEAMLQGALVRLERELPELLLHREAGGRLVHVELAGHRSAVDVGEAGDLAWLAEALSSLAAELGRRLPADTPEGTVEYALLEGALATLDPHTGFLRPDRREAMSEEDAGAFGGIGVTIRSELGRVLVAEVEPGGPAEAAGLRPEDHIVRVGDRPTFNLHLDEVARQVRGPVGEAIRVEVRRPGTEELLRFDIPRAEIAIEPVEGELLVGDVAYIRVPVFHALAARGLVAELVSQRRATDHGLQGLVIDLRGNPGGYLNQAVDIANLFLFSGEILQVLEAGREPERIVAYMGETESELPLVILVDEESASAAEIVAGSLQQRGRAWVVGQPTFGKGSVQTVYPNPDGSALKLTVAQYLLPGGQSLQGRGVVPDVAVIPVQVGEGGVRVAGRRTLREADLSGTLAASRPAGVVAREADGGLLRLAYLDPRAASAEDDPEVELARRLALAAEGPERDDLYGASLEVLAGWGAEREAQVAEVLGAAGLPWTPGDRPGLPSLAVRLAGGEALRSGERGELGVFVANWGREDLPRLSLEIESPAPWLEGAQVVVGSLPAGASRILSLPVDVPAGLDAQEVPLLLHAWDERGELAWSRELLLPVAGAPRSRLLAEVVGHDGEGDGDGLPEPGEVLGLRTTLLNAGEGLARAPVVRVAPDPLGRYELLDPALPVGSPRDARGAPCPDLEAPGCALRLAPGESATVTLRVALSEALPEAGHWPVRVLLADREGLDYLSVVEAGFGEFAEHALTVHLDPREPTRLRRTEPPRIEVVPGAGGVISGVVRDEAGVASLLIFRGEDKIAVVNGGEGSAALPFSVELGAGEGARHLTLLARDTDGLVSTHTVRVPRNVEAPAPEEAEALRAALEGATSPEELQ